MKALKVFGIIGGVVAAVGALVYFTSKVMSWQAKRSKDQSETNEILASFRRVFERDWHPREASLHYEHLIKAWEEPTGVEWLIRLFDTFTGGRKLRKQCVRNLVEALADDITVKSWWPGLRDEDSDYTRHDRVIREHARYVLNNFDELYNMVNVLH